MGFSMLLFLALFVGYWLTLIAVEAVNPKLAHKMIGYKEGKSIKIGKKSRLVSLKRISKIKLICALYIGLLNAI